ncbi:FixJ family two-component response regulator [Pseudochelatococcus contaminans]|uniref:FixJ family two-component response regulator n=1 Tax=Pseudochelatococcus contaminans TaxID=1538103 RepID=A0A7W5Z2E9_9HYPH|nr:FixJ family two-component response regulator [Pseudochelatococcus contaminans]
MAAVNGPGAVSDEGDPDAIGKGGGRGEVKSDGICRCASKNRLVLVIDDDPAVLGSLKFSLEIEGFSVRCYDSPAAFLAASDLPLRACLIVDHKLPGMNGLDLLYLLPREHRAIMPAILITSYPSASLRSRADAAGVRIVEKPFLSNALSEAICQVMSATT